MNRRTFLGCGAGVALGGLAATLLSRRESRTSAVQDEFSPRPPAYSIIPVVGDGKWIWTEPPTGATGYLEPRQFDLKLGIELKGTGSATAIKATTVAPLDLPEQKVNSVSVATEGCAAEVRRLAPEAAQLFLAAPGIVAGQSVGAVATYRLTLHKEYHGYEKDRFPSAQKYSKDFKRLYLTDSPGIQTRIQEVRELSKELTSAESHPWDKARAYYQWVWENIKARVGPYTSVVAALRDRVGDCEERASVFVAFCRAAEIPARLVWVPNHNWAEFYLSDEEGQGHWIPAHTSCYSWFGWTGAHELVLQKGDSIAVPEKSKPLRLAADWMQWSGARPKVRYYAELTPVASKENEDPGPGARSKDEKGEWLNIGKHAGVSYVRR